MNLSKRSKDRDWTPYMLQALDLAREAERLGDVPVGAVLVDFDGKVVASAYNQREIQKDPMAHAEVLCLRRGAEISKNWRLGGYTLIVSLEPCVMCAGALSLARIDRVVFGASDTRAGAMGSLYKIHEDKAMNHWIEVRSGILEEECRKLLIDFFRSRRDK